MGDIRTFDILTDIPSTQYTLQTVKSGQERDYGPTVEIRRIHLMQRPWNLKQSQVILQAMPVDLKMVTHILEYTIPCLTKPGGDWASPKLVYLKPIMGIIDLNPVKLQYGDPEKDKSNYWEWRTEAAWTD